MLHDCKKHINFIICDNLNIITKSLKLNFEILLRMYEFSPLNMSCMSYYDCFKEVVLCPRIGRDVRRQTSVRLDNKVNVLI